MTSCSSESSFKMFHHQQCNMQIRCGYLQPYTWFHGVPRETTICMMHLRWRCKFLIWKSKERDVYVELGWSKAKELGLKKCGERMLSKYKHSINGCQSTISMMTFRINDNILVFCSIVLAFVHQGSQIKQNVLDLLHKEFRVHMLVVPWVWNGWNEIMQNKKSEYT